MKNQKFDAHYLRLRRAQSKGYEIGTSCKKCGSQDDLYYTMFGTVCKMHRPTYDHATYMKECYKKKKAVYAEVLLELAKLRSEVAELKAKIANIPIELTESKQAIDKVEQI